MLTVGKEALDTGQAGARLALDEALVTSDGARTVEAVCLGSRSERRVNLGGMLTQGVGSHVCQAEHDADERRKKPQCKPRF